MTLILATPPKSNPSPHSCPFALFSQGRLRCCYGFGTILEPNGLTSEYTAGGDSQLFQTLLAASRSRVRGRTLQAPPLPRSLPSPALSRPSALNSNCSVFAFVMTSHSHFPSYLAFTFFSPTLLPWSPLSLRGVVLV